MTSADARCGVAVCLLLTAFAIGCGSQTYERRFDETKQYFSYLDRLNQVLAKTPWRGQGLEIRLPKQFQAIAAAAAPASEGSARDPRQPAFADITLPGLQGSWEADLKLAGGEGKAKGYVYILSNYELLGTATAAEQAANFNADIDRTIATAVSQQPEALEKLSPYDVPKGEGYVKPKKYKTDNPPWPAKIEDKDYRIQFYNLQKEKSPAQVTVVCVLPENLSPTEKLDKAFDLSLETLNITEEKPPAATQKGPGAAKIPPPKAAGF